MAKPIYNRKGWVLGHCVECGNLDYVEPHGTTAFCKKQRKETEHENIPYEERDYSGNYYVGKKKSNPSLLNKWIPATAVKVNSNGTVSIKRKKVSNPRLRGHKYTVVAEGGPTIKVVGTENMLATVAKLRDEGYTIITTKRPGWGKSQTRDFSGSRTGRFI